MQASGVPFCVGPMAGPPGYLEWSVSAPLRRYVSCTWTGGLDPARPGRDEPVLPDGCMDVIWNGERLFVAGPDTGPVAADHGGPWAVGARFRPGMAPLFLGAPASELLDQRVDADHLWSDAASLTDRLSSARSLRAAAVMIEDRLLDHLADLPEPDPVVEAVCNAWSRASVHPDADDLSPRQIRRRFTAAVGYGPKLLQRVLRFQAFLGATAAEPAARLADLAAAVGYADQAHLTRETGRLAGRTPAQLRAARVRNVQDRA